MRPQAKRPGNIAPVPIPARRFPTLMVFPARASSGRRGTLRLEVPDAEDKSAGSAATDASEIPGPDVPTMRATPDVLVAAVRLRAVDPEYPNVMRAAQIEGDVLLQVTIGTDGRTSGVTVVKSAHPLLDAAARKAVLQYQYAPASRNGDPEASTIRIAVSFRLR
jgi:TonB family protein